MGVENRILDSEAHSMNKSMHTVIETIQSHMEEGSLVWHNPCLLATQTNAVSGNAYQGINQFITALVADTEGYQSPYWATFKQVRELGGNLIDAKGKGVPIIFYKTLPSKAGDDEGQERFVIRHSFVFNLDLVSGIEVDRLNIEPVGQACIEQDAEAIAAAYLARENLRVNHGRPAYVPSLDLVKMPGVDEVVSTDEFYSTYFHELAHSTGHPARLCRFGAEVANFESKEDYSKEELVAEITAAMLCHECGVDSQASIRNSAAYLQGWSRFIRDQESAFLSAINQAYKARAFILTGKGV
jgi:antirestriction protein ArdC